MSFNIWHAIGIIATVVFLMEYAKPAKKEDCECKRRDCRMAWDGAANSPSWRAAEYIDMIQPGAGQAEFSYSYSDLMADGGY